MKLAALSSGRIRSFPGSFWERSNCYRAVSYSIIAKN